MPRQPGQVRDAIKEALREAEDGEATPRELHTAVTKKLGTNVPQSSIRSYLRLNTPKIFERTGRGRYRMIKND